MNRFKIIIPLLFCSITLFSQSLSDGWYEYSFNRSSRNLQMEEQYRAMGIETFMETRESYSGIPVEVRNGRFVEPTLMEELILDSQGRITSTLPSVDGQISQGELQWSGKRDHWGYEIHMVTEGKLEPIASNQLAPSALNGSYLIRHALTQREMVVELTDGYLIFTPVVRTEEDQYVQGWPLLVQRDGSFYSQVDIEVVAKMNYQVDPNNPETQSPQADSVHRIIIEGRISPQEGLVMEMYQSDSTINDRAGDLPPLVYGGMKLGQGQMERLGLPSPMAPEDLAARTSPAQTIPLDQFPQWFFNAQAPEDGLVYSSYHEDGDAQRALAMAEAKAAAGLAFQIQVDLNSSFQDYSKTNEQGEVIQEYFESRLEEIAFTPLNYQVQRSFYDESQNRAFVIAEIDSAQREAIINQEMAGVYGQFGD